MEGGKEKHMRNISDSSVQGAGMVFSNQHTEIAHVLPRHEVYLYVLGFAALGANKIRHALQGYKTPRTFSHKDIEKGIEYIFKVVLEWEENLVEYTGEQNPFGNKDVLEVGPGPDLGTGVILLAKGARSYTALDRNNLIRLTDNSFYTHLLNQLREFPNYERAKRNICLFLENKPSALTYVWDRKGDLAGLSASSFDLFVSRAMLEHVEDVSGFFRRVKSKLRENASMLHLVDIKTHTRYIKNIDPLNILRYGDVIYNLLKFNGSPNRLRIMEYLDCLQKCGYEDIRAVKKKVADADYINRIKRNLQKKFENAEEIDTLSFWLFGKAN